MKEREKKTKKNSFYNEGKNKKLENILLAPSVGEHRKQRKNTEGISRFMLYGTDLRSCFLGKLNEESLVLYSLFFCKDHEYFTYMCTCIT